MSSDTTSARRGRGRPKSKVTREAVIAVARVLFLELGPHVPIERIAAQAGVSKPLLYRQFGDRDALVEAVLERETQRATSPRQASQYAKMEFAEALVAFGLRYVGFASDQLRGWGHLAVGMLPRHPDLARQFFEKGPAKDHSYLAGFIAEGAARNILTVEDPVEAAGDLLGFWLGLAALEINLHVRPSLSEDEIAIRVERGVARFMRFYAPHDQSD